MYCHKCGSVIHAETAVCDHCGVSVDHHANSMAYLPRNIVSIPKNKIRSYSRVIKNAMVVNVLIWMSLAFPAVVLPYLFKWSSVRYQNFSFAVAYVSLGVMLLFIFYFLKKEFINPLKKVHY